MKTMWGAPSLTLPLSYTRMQDDVAAIVNQSDILYYIYNAGEYVTVMNSAKARDRAIKGVGDWQVYACDLNAQKSERIF